MKVLVEFQRSGEVIKIKTSHPEFIQTMQSLGSDMNEFDLSLYGREVGGGAWYWEIKEIDRLKGDLQKLVIDSPHTTEKAAGNLILSSIEDFLETEAKTNKLREEVRECLKALAKLCETFGGPKNMENLFSDLELSDYPEMSVDHDVSWHIAVIVGMGVALELTPLELIDTLDLMDELERE